MKFSRAVVLWSFWGASSLGCSQVVGADFDGLVLAPKIVSGGSGGAEAKGGIGGNEAAGNGGEAGTSAAGEGGGTAASAGASGRADAGSGGDGGTTAGAGGSAGKGGSGGKQDGEAGTGGMGGGPSIPVPPRVCGDMTGLDEDAPWPMEGACPTRIGRASGKLAPLSPSSLAVFEASTNPDAITGESVIDAEGNIYVATRRFTNGDNSFVLRSFSNKGAPRWELPIPLEVPNAPVLTRFGGVPSLLVTSTFQIRLLDRETRAPLGGVASSGAFIARSPVVSGGTVFFANGVGALHAWRPDDPEGDNHVSFDGGNAYGSVQSPAIGADGTIYFTKYQANQVSGMLYALTLQKSPLKLVLKWMAPFQGSPSGGRLAVAGDGTIVFTTDKKLLGFTPEGAEAFAVDAPVLESAPSILGDLIFHAGAEGKMFCLTTKGKKLYEAPADYASSFLITAEGHVTYFEAFSSPKVRTINGATGISVNTVGYATFNFQNARMGIDPQGRPVLTRDTSVLGFGNP